MKLATHRIPGLVLTDHEFAVPLNHQQPTADTLTVFAREVVTPENEHKELPWLVFLQGGPGFPSPRPTTKSSWLKRALQEYRVLLLDQRGTGRSTPVTFQSMSRFSLAREQADYLSHFRADAIVQDCELIRQELIGLDSQWSVLGQSYGGFCVVHYLSVAPESLRDAFITGGIPPTPGSVDGVYRATYQRLLEKNRRYYERYPDDMERARQIVDHLQHNDVFLPTGDRLTARRFQQGGLPFGMSDGFETLHYVLEQAFVPGSSELSYGFLRNFENLFHFDTNPIYALLHEPIYCEGFAANWSAERVHAEFPAFEIQPDQPIFFTGEMIYPWMFDEYRHLEPLRDAAHVLAATDTWPALYDPETLNQNSVPCAAAVYYNDMYVDRRLSEETAAKIKGIKLWITTEYEHNGLRADGNKILDHLIKMVRGEVYC